MVNHTIVHFEIAAFNPERIQQFYAQLFGWKFQQMPGGGDYWLIETAPQGKGVGGGLVRRQNPPTNYIQVESVADFSKKVKELGGTIVVPKATVPGFGYFAIAVDPEGNLFGLWEDDPKAR